MKKINDYFEVSEDAEYKLIDGSLLKVYKGTGLAIKEGAIADACEDGAVAKAMVKDAIAEAWTDGAIAQAMKDGAVAKAMVKGAYASAWRDGAIAYAMVKGSVAAAWENGAIAEAMVKGAIVIECTEFKEKYAKMSRKDFLKACESLIEGEPL